MEISDGTRLEIIEALYEAANMLEEIDGEEYYPLITKLNRLGVALGGE